MKKCMIFLKKYWLYILIGLVLVVGIKGLFSLFKKGGLLGSYTGTKGPQETINLANDNLDKIKIKKEVLSKTETALDNIANGQLIAMLGTGNIFGLGTKEDDLFNGLVGLNTEDLRYIAKSFGVQERKAFGLVSIFVGDIFGWYESDLSGVELERMKSIWSKTGLWS